MEDKIKKRVHTRSIWGTWYIRKWTEKRTNLEILNTASSTRKLMSNVKRRQAQFLGHVMRKGKLEHLLTTGKIEGKRSRGRQRIKIQDGIAAWLGRSTAEMFVDARDREKWKVMIAYACNRHGNWRRRYIKQSDRQKDDWSGSGMLEDEHW